MDEITDQVIREKWREICTATRRNNHVVDSGSFAIDLVRWFEENKKQEINRLKEYEKRLTDIEEFINEADPLKFVDATIKDGKITDAIVKGSFARIVVQSLVRLFIDSGSKNYLEIEMQKTMIDESKPPEWYTLVIQKKNGMTPAQKAEKYSGLLQKYVFGKCSTCNYMASFPVCTKCGTPYPEEMKNDGEIK